MKIPQSLLTAVVLLTASGAASSAAQAASFANSNFTMITPGGSGDPYSFGGTNDVVGTWDGSLNTSAAGNNFNMTISSPSRFFSQLWYAHDIRVFGPGTYTFNAGCTPGELQAGTDPGACLIAGASLTMTVGPGQIGGHMLFDWGINSNIDVVNVWSMNGQFDSNHLPRRLWAYDLFDVNDYSALVGTVYATEDDAYAAWNKDLAAYRKTVWDFVSTDVDGDGVPGAGMVDGPFINYNANFNLKIVPLPAAVWLFGSGLLGLVGLAGRGMKKSIM